MACRQYAGLGAETIHHFAGLKDGRHTDQELLHLLETDSNYSAAKNRIVNCEVLIIDEISMLSEVMLNQVEFIFRRLRNSDQIFGNVQRISVGDFKQLRPVPNMLTSNDPGRYCFLSKRWNDMFPHRVLLDAVVRQNEKALVNAVAELSDGKVSESTEKLLMSLSRPLPNEYKPTKLFATNMQVNICNSEALIQLDGEKKDYNSVDTGKHLVEYSVPLLKH